MKFQMFEDLVVFSVDVKNKPVRKLWSDYVLYLGTNDSMYNNVINFNGTFKLDDRKDVVVVDITG